MEYKTVYYLPHINLNNISYDDFLFLKKVKVK